MSARAVLLASVALLLAAPAGALAAPPANDAPAAPGTFDAVTAENGTPTERQAIAELVEATGDPGVAGCLGAGSFERTVWFRVPEAPAPREIAVEAAGRTLDVLDLAAFVQPAGAAAGTPATAEANACAGVGAGGADAGGEPTAGVSLRVPAGRAVLIQAGRRGARGSADDERAVLNLRTRDLPAGDGPAGDVADAAAPVVANGAGVPLFRATLTEEDPAQPSCPSLGSVWRRFVPTQTGSRNVLADGAQVGALTVFAGDRPTGDNAVACVNRARAAGELGLTVPIQAGVPLWIRLGTDRPGEGAAGTLRVVEGPPITGGGPGGNGARPATRSSCRPSTRRSISRARLRVSRRSIRVQRLNRYRTVRLRLGRVRVTLCAARISLVGPRGRVYARGTVRRVTGRAPVVRIKRLRRLTRGAYRLRVTALSAPGNRRVAVRTSGRARLR